MFSVFLQIRRPISDQEVLYEHGKMLNRYLPFVPVCFSSKSPNGEGYEIFRYGGVPDVMPCFCRRD